MGQAKLQTSTLSKSFTVKIDLQKSKGYTVFLFRLSNFLKNSRYEEIVIVYLREN